MSFTYKGQPTDFTYNGHQIELKSYQMAYVSTRQDGHGNSKTLLREGRRWKALVDGKEVCINQVGAAKARNFAKKHIDSEQSK